MMGGKWRRRCGEERGRLRRWAGVRGIAVDAGVMLVSGNQLYRWTSVDGAY